MKTIRAEDAKPGMIVRPFLNERTFKPTKKEVLIISIEPITEGAFAGLYVDLNNEFLCHVDDEWIVVKE